MGCYFPFQTIDTMDGFMLQMKGGEVNLLLFRYLIQGEILFNLMHPANGIITIKYWKIQFDYAWNNKVLL